MIPTVFLALLLFVLLVLLPNAYVIVKQNTIAVIVRFGKYHSLRPAGFQLKAPFIDAVKHISLQNVSSELKFQAITKDQANVYFKALIIVSVKDATEDTITKVAFLFISYDSFQQALSKTIEGMVRSFIAGKDQKEILNQRREIVDYVQEHIKPQLDNWGYSLHDIQINDISFDEEITMSMSKVVASSNLLAAATNEGNALLIRKTKEAEAEGKALIIKAESEKTAEILRGQGVAGFRDEIAKGLKNSVKEVGGGSDPSEHDTAVALITFSMWMDALKHIAEKGQGNFISFDGSSDSMKRYFESIVIKNGKIEG